MYLSKEQLTATLRRAWKHSRRDHLMILLGAQHGLRRTEIASLTLADVSAVDENGCAAITVARLKGSFTTTQCLFTNDHILLDEVRALEQYLAERRELGITSDLLFGGISGVRVSQIIQSHMVAAGVSANLAHAHSLKHFCGATMIHMGQPVEKVAKFLGHRDCKNTINFYAHISDAEASAAAQEAFKS